MLRGSSWRAGTMKTPPPMPSIAATIPTRRARMGRKIISNMVVEFYLLDFRRFINSVNCSLIMIALS